MQKYYKIPINPRLISNTLGRSSDSHKPILDNFQFFSILNDFIRDGYIFYIYTKEDTPLAIPQPMQQSLPQSHYDNIMKLTDITDLIDADKDMYTAMDPFYSNIWDLVDVVPDSKIFNDGSLIISKTIMETFMYSQLLSFLVLHSSGIVGPINTDISTIYNAQEKPYTPSDDVLYRIKSLFAEGVELFSENIFKHITLEETLKNNPIITSVDGFDEWIDVVLGQQIGVKEIVYVGKHKESSIREYLKIENIKPVPLKIPIKIDSGETIGYYDNYSTFHKAFKSDYTIAITGTIVVYREYESFDESPPKVDILARKVNAQLGFIPLMVGSRYSPVGQYLSKIPKNRWNEALQHIDSSPFTWGGYYITSGMNRVYMNQKTLSINKPHVYEDPGQPGMIRSTITSSTDLGDSLTNFYIVDNVIMYSLRSMNKKKMNILILVELYKDNLNNLYPNHTINVKDFLFNQIRSYCYDIILEQTDIHKISQHIDAVNSYIGSTFYQFENFVANKIQDIYQFKDDMYTNWLPQISMNMFDPGYYQNKYTIINETLSKFYFTSILVGNLILSNIVIIPSSSSRLVQ